MDDVLAKLSPPERDALRASVEALRVKQREAIASAIDRALEQLPWVLRGAVRKVLFP